MSDILVVKIGGSTLGNHDTTLEDLVTLQRRGLRSVVVHGGGALISQWLSRHNVPTRFERGLRGLPRASAGGGGGPGGRGGRTRGGCSPGPPGAGTPWACRGPTAGCC